VEHASVPEFVNIGIDFKESIPPAYVAWRIDSLESTLGSLNVYKLWLIEVGGVK
jgi:hypothetical protein